MKTEALSALRGTVNVLVPVGALGAGIKREDVANGIAMGADAIACDAGSTDSGPSYLARGVSKVSRESVKRDIAAILPAAMSAGIPLLIGSCGTAGTDSGVEWTRSILMEVAREHNLTPRIACLFSEVSREQLRSKLDDGKVSSLPPLGDLSVDRIERCEHIVALMGVEPYIAALRDGADVVLGGRTSDTAVLGCVPLMKGAGAGPAWHAAKITECGGLCTVNPREGGVMMRVGSDFFEIEPLTPQNTCNAYTVSAHMLYENSDPYRLIEPGGVLDVSDAHYEEVDSRRVRVTGSRWEPKPYTMKLEGAGIDAHQTIMFIGIRDPKVLKNLDVFQERMIQQLMVRVDDAIGAAAGTYDLSLRVYGWNGVTGVSPSAGTPAPVEVGVMLVVTAESQEMATRIAQTCNPLFFHFPLDRGMELPTYAYPFSPAEIERGPVYEFHLNHVVAVDDPCELVRVTWADMSVAAPKEATYDNVK